MELLSVAMLFVISTFALDFIHSDRGIFKMVDLDEAWTFLQVAQGKALSNKLIRAGRSMNVAVYFVTQNSGDVDDEKMKNNIGLKFAFRSTDIKEIKNTLEFFGVDKEDEGNQKRLRDLENGQCLFQDLYGRVGVIQIHPVFATCSLPLTPDRRYIRKNRGEVYEETKNPKILRYRSAGRLWRAGVLIHHGYGGSCGWSGRYYGQ